MERRYQDDPEWVERFTSLMVALAATFWREADEPMLEGFALGLGDLPIAAIETAVKRAMRESRFWPTVAALRDLAGVMTPEQRATIAWTVVNQSIKSVGYYNSPDFDDPLIVAAIHAVFPAGWLALCDAAGDGGKDWEAHTRREFIAAYVRLMNGGATRVMTRPLVGFFERENMKNGHKPPKRKLVVSGLPKHARSILVQQQEDESHQIEATSQRVLLKGP